MTREPSAAARASWWPSTSACSSQPRRLSFHATREMSTPRLRPRRPRSTPRTRSRISRTLRWSPTTRCAGCARTVCWRCGRAPRPLYSQMAVSDAVGIDQDQVEVHVTFAGGTFGLHSTSSHDPTAEAAQVARGLDWKYPVRVQSLREEDFKTGHYRPMAAHRVRAGADAAGHV